VPGPHERAAARLRPVRDDHVRVLQRVPVHALLTPAEVAELFKVNPLTVMRWANQGRIGSVRTLGGHTRYKEAEVLRFLNEATREAGPPSRDER
jgi:excisionase family DNA binding protein